MPEVTELFEASALAGLRALLLDLDGVAYRGDEAMPEAAEFFSFLSSRCIRFCLITNNSTRTPAQVVAKLARLGISVDEEQVVTSAEATADYLSAIASPRSRVLVVGSSALRVAMRRARFRLTPNQPDYVVVGLDVKLTYDKLRRATIALRHGARFIASNADATLPTEEGEIPGSGAIVAALQAASGVAPTVVGKPEPLMLEMAMRRLGVGNVHTAIVGDRLETDIVAGWRVGIRTILVLTGVTARADVARGTVQPDFVCQDLGELRRALESSLSTGYPGREK